VIGNSILHEVMKACFNKPRTKKRKRKEARSGRTKGEHY
jgi:hypothetical protein